MEIGGFEVGVIVFRVEMEDIEDMSRNIQG